MTSTEVLDPFANVQQGRAVADYPGWDSSAHGIWCARGYTWCAAAGPESHYACSRPQGHPTSWNHIACTEGGNGGRGTVHEVWGAVDVPLEPDPHAGVTTETRASSYDRYREICVGDTGQWCRENNPEGSGVCSRPSGHPAHWQHIAGTGSGVLSVWPGTPAMTGPPPGWVDPHAAVTDGQYIEDRRGWNDNVTGIRVANALYCRQTNPNYGTTTAFCTRAIEHFGKHISTNSRRVLWVMDNVRDLVVPLEAVPDPDPEDGTPVDDESTVYTESPEIGDVVRLRDRENRLYVMAKRNDTAEVEVLDLKRKELRAIPINHCVRQDAPLSVAELQWVAQWYSGHRDAVRKIAVREYRKDRWCMDGLNQNLRTLGLPKYEPSLRGNIRVTLPFECTDIHAGQDAIESKVNAALHNPEVAAALRLALPLVDGIELQPDELAVRASDFSRK